MGRPLTAGERDALVAGRFYGPPPSSSLARYEATVRAVEAERDEWRRNAHEAREWSEIQAERMNALRERVERLRAALEWIAFSEPPSPEVKEWNAIAYIEVARDALREAGE